MGGRVALVLLELMPERVKSLLLLAPDGFKINLIYKFASETKLGRSMYKYLIDHPGWLFQSGKSTE
jgi:pimeloyl-ACP methyl ester carboxylesterase